VVFALFRARPRPKSHSNSVTEEKSDDEISGPDSPDSELKLDQRKRSKTIRRVIPSCLVLGSVGLSVFAAYLDLHGHPHIAGTLLLGAFALSAFLIRGPHWHYTRTITFLALILFWGQLDVVVLIALRAVRLGADPAALLEITALSVCSLSLVLFVIVTWIRGWPFAEPIAVGLFAVSLGALCLPVLPLISSPHLTPNFNESGSLYATGPANQELSLTVRVDTIDGPRTTETFQINNRGKSAIKWALLLTGDARLRAIAHASSNIDKRALTVGSSFVVFPPAKAQLLSGSIKGYSAVTFTGSSFGQFTASGGPETMVELPPYEEGAGVIASGTPATRLIIDALKGRPIFRDPRHFSIIVSAGRLPPSDSLSEVYPNLTPTAKDPTELRWVSNGGYVQPFYETINQGMATAGSGVLFVFGILLGVAGAALVGSLQGTVHILSSRKSA
jgi:hypothetical protein